MVTAATSSSGFHRILVAVDCSDASNAATEEAVRLARLWGSEITGLHAYAAKLHDYRFRQMEGGLPEQYRKEAELERQRDVHDDLITRGLSLITDSYLDQTERICSEAKIPFSRLGREGRNYRVVLEQASEGNYDVLVLGSQGLGAVRPGAIGTVCERVVRRTTVDTLVIKDSARALGDGPILVALDGSAQSFGALLTALELGRKLDAPVHAVAVYDPFFHYVAFNRIAEVLSDEAGKVFRFEEQEKLHEEIIDSGLAKIYQAHLAIATSIARDLGRDLETTLLAGKPYDALAKHVQTLEPSLLLLGKIGVHADDDLDIGGNTERLLRLADCHLWISLREHEPEVERVARETTSWTEEAEAQMQRVPGFVRNMARMAILRYAQEKGHTVITASIVQKATEELMPAHAHRMMKEIVEDKESQSLDGTQRRVAALLWAGAARSLVGQVEPESLRRNLELRAEKLARSLKVPQVEEQHVRPFLPEETESPSIKTAPEWTEEALARLERVPAGFMRDASRRRIEEHARGAGRQRVTLEIAETSLAEARQKMAEALGADGEPDVEEGDDDVKACPFQHGLRSTKKLPRTLPTGD